MNYVRVVVFLVLSWFCLWQLYQTLSDFLNGDQWTNSNTLVEVPMIEMPEILFCNYNRIDQATAADLGISEEKMMHYAKRAGLESLATQLLHQLRMIMIIFRTSLLFGLRNFSIFSK